MARAGRCHVSPIDFVGGTESSRHPVGEVAQRNPRVWSAHGNRTLAVRNPLQSRFTEQPRTRVNHVERADSEADCGRGSHVVLSICSRLCTCTMPARRRAGTLVYAVFMFTA
jgi:hypothetical protein